MPMTRSGPPGSHSHSDRPNWQPAETADDYLRNCQDGLQAYSDRRMAKLLGWSRAHLWRAKLMAEIPEDLFERLLARADHVPSTKELANVARALNVGGADHRRPGHRGGFPLPAARPPSAKRDPGYSERDRQIQIRSGVRGSGVRRPGGPAQSAAGDISITVHGRRRRGVSRAGAGHQRLPA